MRRPTQKKTSYKRARKNKFSKKNVSQNRNRNKILSLYSSASALSTENGSGTGIDPQSAITTSFDGLSLASVLDASIWRTTFMPFRIFPNTTCLPSNHGVCFVVMKNCDPFVSLPAFAYIIHGRCVKIMKLE